MSLFDQLLELAPTHNEAAFARANVLSSLDRRDEAVAAFRYSIRVNQYHAESTHNLGVHLMTAAGEQVESLQRKAAVMRGSGGGSEAQQKEIDTQSKEVTATLGAGVEVSRERAERSEPAQPLLARSGGLIRLGCLLALPLLARPRRLLPAACRCCSVRMR